MAIYGKDNIIEHARAMGLVYWRIYQSQTDKNAGNFVASADFDKENLGQEESLTTLRRSLDRLTGGSYLLSVYTKPGISKGGVNTNIELEGNGLNAISGINNTSAVFHLEGIGAVTPDNFEEAVEKKMQKMLDAQKEKEERELLRKENVELKKQLRENEGGVNRGLMAVGSVLYATVSKSPAGAEFIGMVKNVFLQAHTANRQQPADSPGPGDDKPGEIGAVNNQEERLIAAVEKLSTDNPEFLQQIEMMARLKEKDPDTFNQGIDALKTITE